MIGRELLTDVKVPMTQLGEIVMKRTYARIKEDGELEDWYDICTRVTSGLRSIAPFLSHDLLQKIFMNMYTMKFMPSGRALWQLGTNTIKRVGGDSLCNCWCFDVTNIDAFTSGFNQLMLGGGVGFVVTRESIYELPHIKFSPKIIHSETPDCDFVTPDNREGWVKTLWHVLNSYFFTHKNFSYNTSSIRKRGTPISTFGGVASGPEVLVEGINRICGVLDGALGRKLTPVEVLDILNIIGTIVVAGNVRRSAEIIVSDCNDLDFIKAKDFSNKSPPPWRSMSNNSVICDHIEDLPDEFWSTFERGDPMGLFNRNVARTHGRLVDGSCYRPDTNIVGLNPCGEITLEDSEPCNLAEVFMPNIKNSDELKDALMCAYLCTKAITCLPYSNTKTAEVVQRNRRIGISLCGLLSSKLIFENGVLNFNLMNEMYDLIESFDKEWSEKLNIPESIKLTTLQPSGTKSLLTGCSPGAHPDFAKYYFRRVSLASNDRLVPALLNAGYNVEYRRHFDGSVDMTTYIATFPVQARPDAVIASDLTALDQLNLLADLQRYWADNAISLTVYYDKNEIGRIENWLKENWKNIKGCSFLLHQNHGFVQAPIEPVTGMELALYESELKPIDLSKLSQIELVDTFECGTGGCPVR